MTVLMRFLCAAFAALLANLCWAQNYPASDIRIIVPAQRGSTLDALAHIVGGEIQRTWGRRVLIDNRPGENGNAGVRAAATAAPDGHTLLMVGPAFAANPHLTENAGYSTSRFVPISEVAELPIVVVVHPVFPAQALKTLIDVVKVSPGQFSFASAGIGSTLHLAGEAFRQSAQVDLTHLPLKSSAQAEAALVSGEVQVLFSPLPAALPYIQAGRVRPLAVNTLERVDALTDIPTMKQAGLQSYDFRAWFGLVAPAGTPAEVVQKLSQHVGRIMRQQNLKSRLSAQQVEAVGSTAQQFAAVIDKDGERWSAAAEANAHASSAAKDAEAAGVEAEAPAAPVKKGLATPPPADLEVPAKPAKPTASKSTDVPTGPKAQDVAMPKAQEVATPKAQEVTTPKSQETTAPKAPEAAAPKATQITAPKAHDVTAPKAQGTTPKPRAATPKSVPATDATAVPPPPPPAMSIPSPADTSGEPREILPSKR